MMGNVSMMVWLNAWPMCSVPVTFGGGSWMEKDGLAVSSVGSYMPLCSHNGAKCASIAAGSNDLARLSRPGVAGAVGVEKGEESVIVE